MPKKANLSDEAFSFINEGFGGKSFTAKVDALCKAYQALVLEHESFYRERDSLIRSIELLASAKAQPSPPTPNLRALH